jgi:hypothetical protein
MTWWFVVEELRVRERTDEVSHPWRKKRAMNGAPFGMVAQEKGNSKNNRRSFDCAGHAMRDRLRSG